MKKVISLLIAIVTLTLLLCSCDNTQVEKSTEPIVVQTEEPVDEVMVGLEKFLSETTHDRDKYAIFEVEGILNRKNGDRVWLVCYIDYDGDSNWYFVEWRGDYYEKFGFQP